MGDTAYNPLSETNLGAHIALALARQPWHWLENHQKLAFAGGGGIYAVYYHGGCPIYRAYRWMNRRSPAFPIYVGSAMTAKTLKGLQSLRREGSEYALCNRILRHQSTIAGFENVSSAAPYPLRIADFSFRYLHLDDSHVVLAGGGDEFP